MKTSKFMSILAFTLVVVLAVTSCSRSAKFEKVAKTQMEATFKEVAKDPSSVVVSNIQTVYSDDSLCILHSDFTAKNG